MSGTKRTSSQTDKLRSLLAYYAERGRSINEMPKLCGRGLNTLKRHARIAGVLFHDYTPRIRNGT